MQNYIPPFVATASGFYASPLDVSMGRSMSLGGNLRYNTVPALVPPFTCNNIWTPLVTVQDLTNRNWIVNTPANTPN